jgi:hypothetical protein
MESNKLFNFSEFLKENADVDDSAKEVVSVDGPVTKEDEEVAEMKSKEDEEEVAEMKSKEDEETPEEVTERVDVEFSEHIFTNLLEDAMLEELSKDDEEDDDDKEDEKEVNEKKKCKSKKYESKKKDEEDEEAKELTESILGIVNDLDISLNESKLVTFNESFLPGLTKTQAVFLGLAGIMAIKRIKKMIQRRKTKQDLLKDIKDPKKREAEKKKIDQLKGKELDAIKTLRDKADKAEAKYKVADAKTKEKMRIEKAKAQEELAKMY